MLLKNLRSSQWAKAPPCARKKDQRAGCCIDWKGSLLAPLQIKGRQLIWRPLRFEGGRETSSGVVACLGGWCHDLPPLSHLFCWLAHSIGGNELNARQASSHVCLNHSVLIPNLGQSSRPSRIDPSRPKPSRIEASVRLNLFCGKLALQAIPEVSSTFIKNATGDVFEIFVKPSIFASK